MRTKKICLSALFLLFPFMLWSQAKLFDKYSDMKGVKSVYISKAMLEMNANLFTSDIYVGKTKNLNSVRLLSTMDAQVRKDMFEDIRSLVKSSKYELWMKQKGTVSGSEFYVSRKGDKIKEVIMIMDGAASLKFIYLEGDMTPEDVKRILLYQDSSSSINTIKMPRWEDLQALQAIDNIEDLKGVQKFFNSDDWKQFEKQMENFGEQFKDLDVGIYKH